MRPSNLHALLSIASCLVLLAALLAACSADESNGDVSRAPSPLSSDECDAQGGFHVFDPSNTSLAETTRCPAGTALVGPISDVGTFALCCFVEYEPCKSQRVQVGATCDTDIAYYWLGSGCAPIRDCACSGPDCDKGYATEDGKPVIARLCGGSARAC
jgi:hypothetical protein